MTHKGTAHRNLFQKSSSSQHVSPEFGKLEKADGNLAVHENANLQKGITVISSSHHLDTLHVSRVDVLEIGGSPNSVLIRLCDFGLFFVVTGF